MTEREYYHNLLDKLISEENELSKKIEKLEISLQQENPNISDIQRSLLREQYKAMVDYHSILCKRIINILEVNINA